MTIKYYMKVVFKDNTRLKKRHISKAHCFEFLRKYQIDKPVDFIKFVVIKPIRGDIS